MIGTKWRLNKAPLKTVSTMGFTYSGDLCAAAENVALTVI